MSKHKVDQKIIIGLTDLKINWLSFSIAYNMRKWIKNNRNTIKIGVNVQIDKIYSVKLRINDKINRIKIEP